MKVKMLKVVSFVDAVEGDVFDVENELDGMLEIRDRKGFTKYIPDGTYEVIEETSKSQDLKDHIHTFTGPSIFTTFKNLQQYASELNIDITFLPENKVAVYIDNTLDKTYTVETEDGLEEVVQALRVVDKYLDKD